MIGFRGRVALLVAALAVFTVAVYMASIRDYGAAVAVGCTALFFAIWALGAGVTDAEQGEKVGELWVETDETLMLCAGDRLILTDRGELFIECRDGARRDLKTARMGADHEFV